MRRPSLNASVYTGTALSVGMSGCSTSKSLGRSFTATCTRAQVGAHGQEQLRFVRGHDWLQVHKSSRALTRLPNVFVNSCCPLERRVMEYHGCALASRENVHLHDLA